MAYDGFYEIELLDQLVGSDMQLAVMVKVFPNLHAARLIIAKSVAAGFVRVRDDTGEALPLWRWQQICRSEYEWDEWVDRLTLSLTDKGMHYFDTGEELP